MLESALFRGGRIPLNSRELLLDDVTVKVEERDFTVREPSDFHLSDVIDIAGVLENRRNVRCQIQVSVLCFSDDHRSVLAGDVNFSRIALEHQCKSIGPADTDHRVVDRIHRSVLVFLIIVIDQLDGDFRIGIAVKLVVMTEKLRFQFLIIFNDPVVDADDVSVIGHVRMRIGLARFAVRCPAGMADSAGPRDRIAAVRLACEARQAPFRLYNDKILIAVADSKARGIIAAVLELRKAFKKNRSRLFTSDITDYSTHRVTCPPLVRSLPQLT